MPDTCSISRFVPDFMQQSINTLGVSRTHRSFSSVGSCVSQAIVSKTSCIVRNLPVWQLLKVCGHKPSLRNCIPATVLAQTSVSCHQLYVDLRMGQQPGPGWQNSHLSQAVTVESNPRLSPSLCYLLAFRHNQSKLCCLMTPPLLCAKHLKRPRVPLNIMWMIGL